MNLIKMDVKQKKALYAITYFALFLGAIFLQEYAMLIMFSAIMAVLFDPIYTRLINKGKGPGNASFMTFLISMLVIIVPVFIICVITYFQINSIVQEVSAESYTQSASSQGDKIVSFVNSAYEQLGIDKTLTVDQLRDNVISAVDAIGQQLFSGLVSSFSNLFSLITAAIIYIYVFLSMLKNKKKILDSIKKLNPLGDDVTDIYIEKSGAMTKATVRGQFIIAFMQGSESAAVLAMVGFHQLFFFFLIFLTFMSLIPMGAGIITIPLGIVMILTGNPVGGIIVIANHLLIVTNVDNVMRPRLVPKSARLDPALMILAVFSGMAIFGFLGIVIGPIIMILIITTLQIFNEVFFEEESVDRTKETKQRSTTMKKLKSISGRAKQKIKRNK